MIVYSACCHAAMYEGDLSNDLLGHCPKCHEPAIFAEDAEAEPARAVEEAEIVGEQYLETLEYHYCFGGAR